MPTWTASAEATAITGYVVESGYGGVIPLTFPILLTQCESGGGSTKLYFPDDGISAPPDNPAIGTPWPFGPNNRIAIPLCSNGPGNVGWIDWSAPNGGASEIAAEIRTPGNPPISTPHWYEVTETGAITSLDDDMDTWEGKDIYLPIFHAEADDPSTAADEELIGTCDAEPANPKKALIDCAAADMGANGQGWYFLETIGVFHLEHSYIQGNHQAECNGPGLLTGLSIRSQEPGEQLPDRLLQREGRREQHDRRKHDSDERVHAARDPADPLALAGPNERWPGVGAGEAPDPGAGRSRPTRLGCTPAIRARHLQGMPRPAWTRPPARRGCPGRLAGVSRWSVEERPAT